MQTGDLIQRVISLYSKGVQSDDARLSRRHVYNKLLTTRSALMFNKLNKKQFISRWNYDTLPCVKMIKVEGHDCPCLPPIGCQILRSEEKLPKPISNLSHHIIDSVTSIDGSVIFSETTWMGKKWRKSDKYTSTKPDYFIKDDYIYITVTRKIKAITVIGLFNDPIEVSNFPSYCDGVSNVVTCPGSPMETEFNIDDDLLDTLIEIAVKELVFAFNQMTEDIANNSMDDVSIEDRRRGRRR